MEQNIGARVAQIIDYKTAGKRAAFAESLGWSKQYLNKLLNSEGVGITAVTSILEHYPDIDARWLLTGEGCMVGTAHLLELMRAWLRLEAYIPHMTPGERVQLMDGRLMWTDEDVARWSRARDAKERELAEKFAKVTAKTANELQIKKPQT